MPCHAIPCPALPCPALPCPALPCPALPCQAMPYHARPCCTMSCHAMPCHALPCYGGYRVTGVVRAGVLTTFTKKQKEKFCSQNSTVVVTEELLARAALLLLSDWGSDSLDVWSMGSPGHMTLVHQRCRNTSCSVFVCVRMRACVPKARSPKGNGRDVLSMEMVDGEWALKLNTELGLKLYCGGEQWGGGGM